MALTRQQREDLVVVALMLGVAYATPRRARPALTLTVAVLLSNQHGRDRARIERELLGLFDQRNSLRALVELVTEELDARLREVEAGNERLYREHRLTDELNERLTDVEHVVPNLGALEPREPRARDAIARIRRRLADRA